MALHAPGQQRFTRVLRQGYQRAYEGLGTGGGLPRRRDRLDSSRTMRACFERLWKHNLKFPPSKASLGNTDADSLTGSILPAGVRPNTGKKSSALSSIEMPMPRDLKQVCALLGGKG